MEEQNINDCILVSSMAKDICNSIDEIEYALRMLEENIREMK